MTTQTITETNDYERRWGEGEVNLTKPTLPSLKIDWVKDRIVAQTGKLLDYGCGEGKLLNTLRRCFPGIQAYGTDIQAPKDQPKGFQFQLKQTDSELLFEGEKFETIVSVDVLEHVDHVPTCLKQIKQHMTDDGRGLFFIPCEGQLFSFYNFYRLFFGRDLYKKTKDHNAYTRKQMLKMLHEEFEVVEVNYAYHFFGSLLDATFFTFCLIPSVAKWFWTKNSIYRPDEKKSLPSYALEFANAICFYESRILRKVPLFSSALLVHVQKRTH